MAQQTWLAKVRCPDREMFWVGHFTADGRTDAKRRARHFVSRILPLETQIISIAQGRIEMKLDGEEIAID